MKAAALALAAALAISFGSLAANAADRIFADPMNGFAVLPLPGSQTNTEGLTDSVRVEFLMPDGSNCNVTAADDTTTTSMTQEQINNHISNGYLQTAATTELHQSDPNGTTENSLIELKGMTGWHTDFAFTLKTEQGTLSAKGYKDIYAVPGKVYNINCMALTQNFPAMAAAFKNLMSSFAVLK